MSSSQVRLTTDLETGRSKGSAHIDFRDADSAQRAVNELNGMEVLGRQLRVKLTSSGSTSGGDNLLSQTSVTSSDLDTSVDSKPKKQRPPSVYISNLPLDLGSDEIKSFVSSEVGSSVKKITIPVYNTTGGHKGYGFLEFESTDAAAKAVEFLKDGVVGGRVLVVNMVGRAPVISRVNSEVCYQIPLRYYINYRFVEVNFRLQSRPKCH